MPSRLTLRSAATIFAAVVGSLAFGSLRSGADGAFTASAVAEGFRLTVTAAGGPATSTPVDSGAPMAQATLDSLGTSRAFASWAYPGEVAIAGPGLVAGFSGGKLNLPGYPLIAQSDAATRPESHVSGGGGSAQARSTSDRSEGSVTAGALASDAVRMAAVTAWSAVARTGSELHAAATNEVDGVAAGPLILGRVRSSAQATRAGQPDVARSSDLRVTGSSVNGTPIEIGPDGVKLAEAAAPLPPAPPVGDQLRQAGITVTYLASQSIDGGIIAAGLVVRVERAVPGPVTPVAVEIRLGRAMAKLEGGPLESANPAPPDGVIGQPGDEAGDLLGADAGADVTAVASAGLAPTMGLAPDPAVRTRVGSPVVVTAPLVESPAASPEGLPVEPSAAPALVSTRPTALFDTDGVYLVVALGGLAVAVCAGLVSRFGK